MVPLKMARECSYGEHDDDAENSTWLKDDLLGLYTLLSSTQWPGGLLIHEHKLGVNVCIESIIRDRNVQKENKGDCLKDQLQSDSKSQFTKNESDSTI